MLIRGQEAKETPTQVPANPKLWNMIKTQALTRFSKNSPAKAHWIHSRYVQMGGKFVQSKAQVDPRMRDYAPEAQDKKEAQEKKTVSKPAAARLVHGERVL